ncbi:MAG: HlyD family efflux transporter periplasmic adaptor subunit [Minisyncoccia bacterium]|jgi:HlyD family secretion protein
MKASNPLFTHPLVLGSIALVAVVAIGSGIYYHIATAVPQTDVSATDATSTAESLTATGTVEPAQNPNLAFQSGGEVANVAVSDGAHVYAGEVLASLDTATLDAARAGAEATLQNQQANLAELQAGPRAVDVAAKQTAIDQANAALQNAYTDAATAITGGYDKSFSSVSSNTDTLFNQASSNNPTLVFSTINTQNAIDAVNTRITAETSLTIWNTETASLSGDTPAQIETELTLSLAHLADVRAYTDALLVALGNAVPSSTFGSASVTAAEVSIDGLQSSINGLISSLQSAQQQITADKLAVESAENALDQLNAGATPQDIAAAQAEVAAAQAQVANIDAQIQNSIVVAPFAGTVASVQVKTGDTVAPNTTAISLNPESALQVVAYFSAIDIANVKVGTPADVTLDAYGNARHFAAHVVSVDTAPSPTSDAAGAPLGYKATLQFASADSAITSGMSANITIPLQ